MWNSCQVFIFLLYYFSIYSPTTDHNAARLFLSHMGLLKLENLEVMYSVTIVLILLYCYFTCKD